MWALSVNSLDLANSAAAVKQLTLSAKIQVGQAHVLVMCRAESGQWPFPAAEACLRVRQCKLNLIAVQCCWIPRAQPVPHGQTAWSTVLSRLDDPSDTIPRLNLFCWTANPLGPKHRYSPSQSTWCVETSNQTYSVIHLASRWEACKWKIVEKTVQTFPPWWDEKARDFTVTSVSYCGTGWVKKKKYWHQVWEHLKL